MSLAAGTISAGSTQVPRLEQAVKEAAQCFLVRPLRRQDVGDRLEVGVAQERGERLVVLRLPLQVVDLAGVLGDHDLQQDRLLPVGAVGALDELLQVAPGGRELRDDEVVRHLHPVHASAHRLVGDDADSTALVGDPGVERSHPVLDGGAVADHHPGPRRVRRALRRPPRQRRLDRQRPRPRLGDAADRHDHLAAAHRGRHRTLDDRRPLQRAGVREGQLVGGRPRVGVSTIDAVDRAGVIRDRALGRRLDGLPPGQVLREADRLVLLLDRHGGHLVDQGLEVSVALRVGDVVDEPRTPPLQFGEVGGLVVGDAEAALGHRATTVPQPVVVEAEAEHAGPDEVRDAPQLLGDAVPQGRGGQAHADLHRREHGERRRCRAARG
ncbi:MAG: hypothetical protein ACK559_04030, partial [bacterium]